MPVRLTVVPNIFEWLLQIGNKIRPIIEKSVVSYFFPKVSSVSDFQPNTVWRTDTQ